MTRGTGITSQQMLEAPRNAVFVWCNQNTWYAKDLAYRLGREDLDIWPLERLHPESILGRTLTGIVVDHAARLNDDAREALYVARTRIRDD